ncbi:MAG: hypothetical protein AAF490_08890 [Chloroflexota bacterium]
MSRRLVDLYPLETAVQIKLGDQWVLGIVVRHQHPAVWVQTLNKQRWFVTNGRRIRLLEERKDEPRDSS